jgi:hypothetical protein
VRSLTPRKAKRTATKARAADGVAKSRGIGYHCQ